MENSPKKQQMPAAIIIWILLMALVAIEGVPLFASYATHPLGLTIFIIFTALLIVNFITIISRRLRLITAISHIAIGGALLILQLIMMISMATCTGNCAAKGGLDIIIVIIALWPPTIFFAAYGLYFLLSKNVKAYFKN